MKIGFARAGLVVLMLVSVDPAFPQGLADTAKMESRYDRAKRELDAAKAELGKFQQMARRAGIRN